MASDSGKMVMRKASISEDSNSQDLTMMPPDKLGCDEDEVGF